MKKMGFPSPEEVRACLSEIVASCPLCTAGLTMEEDLTGRDWGLA